MQKWILSLVIFIQAMSFNVQAGDADFEYFKQFLYREESVGSDPDFPEYQYRYLMSDYNAPLIPMADGRYLKARTEIQLFANGTYKALYNEYIFEKPDAMQFMPGICKVITGKWSVPDKLLVMEGLGVADRAILSGVYGVSLTYAQDYSTSGLKGHTTNFNFGYSMDPDIRCFPF